MTSALLSIARFTVLECTRTRLPWIGAGVLAVVLLAAEFAAGLAITDSAAYRSGVYAALGRFALVLVVILFVAASVVRELGDRLLDLCLSRPVSRASWLLGRWLGFGAVALSLAALAAVPLLFSAAPPRVLAWALSLAGELWLMATVCLTCTLTLRQLTPAVTASVAFYVLARAIDAIVLMSHGPASAAGAWSSEVIAGLVALIALLLPALDRYTQAAWLAGSAALPDALPLTAGVLVYTALVLAVGLFDLYRLND